jgi:hypothetical protein
MEIITQRVISVGQVTSHSIASVHQRIRTPHTADGKWDKKLAAAKEDLPQYP